MFEVNEINVTEDKEKTERQKGVPVNAFREAAWLGAISLIISNKMTASCLNSSALHYITVLQYSTAKAENPVSQQDFQ